MRLIGLKSILVACFSLIWVLISLPAAANEEVAGEVLDLLDDGEYEEALVVLKEGANTVSLARMPGAEKSWKLIPNPDLDPYS